MFVSDSEFLTNYSILNGEKLNQTNLNRANNRNHREIGSLKNITTCISGVGSFDVYVSNVYYEIDDMVEYNSVNYKNTVPNNLNAPDSPDSGWNILECGYIFGNYIGSQLQFTDDTSTDLTNSNI